jgi:hypothetical protein
LDGDHGLGGDGNTTCGTFASKIFRHSAWKPLVMEIRVLGPIEMRLIWAIP